MNEKTREELEAIERMIEELEAELEEMEGKDEIQNEHNRVHYFLSFEIHL